MTHWLPVAAAGPLWRSTSSLLFVCVHCIGWIAIVGTVLIVDYSEFLGLKQVYYYLIGQESPISKKSPSLQRLYSHMRHPLFTGLTLILWCQPVMSFDRLLLAVVWTLYLALGHNLDIRDYQYLKEQLQVKHQNLMYHKSFQTL
uniref:Nuclear envelope membrane protein n=1 Tax=Saccoglossus kowalevskii TaxID=10224 RepID=A0ABM0MH93_SACKO|nr:PREDICTED: nurim-like [Saccoglossus kowalevskii]